MVLILTTCFVGLYIWFSAITFHFPYMGIELAEKENQWVVSGLDKNGMGQKIGLKIGDSILEIDHKDPGQNFFVRKWGNIEQVHSIRIERRGQTFDIPVDNRLNTHDYHFFFISSILGILCFGLAIFIWMKAHAYPSAQKLALVFLAMSLIFIGLGASAREDALAKFIVMNAVMVLPVCFIHFILDFIREKGHYALPVKPLRFADGVIVLFFLARFSYLTPLRYEPYFPFDRLLTLWIFAAGLLINLVILFIIYLRSRKENPYLSAIMKIIWITLFLSFSPIICLSIVPEILFGDPWMNYFYSGSFVFLLPLLIVYLIFAHQLFNIHILLQRIFFFLSLSFLPAMFVSALFFLIVREPLRLTTMVCFLLVASIDFAIVLYLQNRFHDRFESLLFPKKHQLQIALHQIINHLKSIHSFRGIEEKILVEIMNTLDVEGVALLFDHQEGREMMGQGSLRGTDLGKLLEAKSVNPELYSLFVLHQEPQYTSFLMIKNKKTKVRFSKEEIDWLHLVIQYLSVVLENVYLIQKLTTKVKELFEETAGARDAHRMIGLRKMIFQLQEKERERMASDLHDTVMQDIYFVKQRLGYLQQQADKLKVARELEDIAEYMDVINYNLRETCFHIYPLLLRDSGLVSAVQNLIKNERKRVPFHIHLQMVDPSVLDRNRIFSLKGNIQIDSDIGQGVCMIMEIPWKWKERGEEEHASGGHSRVAY